jgi:hypothetical protein
MGKRAVPWSWRHPLELASHAVLSFLRVSDLRASSCQQLAVLCIEWFDKTRLEHCFEVPEHTLLGLIRELRVLGLVEACQPLEKYEGFFSRKV